MGRAALILVAFLLAGCAAAQTEEQAKAEADAKDSAQCQAHGYQPGSLNYDDCMAKLADLRTQADRTALSGRLRSQPPPWAQH
jgi:outer membrane biogenesis lipoprotein LolB